jgi:phytoene synthase
MIITDIEYCRYLLQGGSRSFHAASLLLPRALREPASALYAFCRVADDVIDLGNNKTRDLARLHRRLDRVYRGRPNDTPVDRAFTDVVERFSIPRALPEALLEGFAWDAEGRRYETLEDLCAYAARVAGSVGVMMTLLMRQRDPLVLARAGELGIAMQLTNIARDIGEDARAGRLYLPLQWLKSERIDSETFLRMPQFDRPLAAVTRRLLNVARNLYERSLPGIAYLPAACRPGIHAARLIYSEIGAEIASRGVDPVHQRAVVSGAAKFRLMTKAVTASLAAKVPLEVPPLREAQFLIDAVVSTPEPAAVKKKAAAGPSWWNVPDRAVRLIALFERIERRKSLDRINP